MNRRDFLKGVVGVFGSVGMAGQAVAKPLEYDRQVCHKLDNLHDYKTKEPFQQDGFVIAYFATPYKKYAECNSDAIKIASAALFAGYAVGEHYIRPALIFSALETGDPAPDFARSYSQTVSGNTDFITLTAEKNLLLRVAKGYRVPFRVDRLSGMVVDHSRSAVLIAPDGALVSKYSASELDQLERYLIEDLKEYRAPDVKEIDCPPEI